MKRHAPGPGRRGRGARRCPFCDGPAYPWIGVPYPGTGATVGMLSPVDPEDPDAARAARLFDRCESCGAGLEQAAIDLADELERITVRRDGEDRYLDAPNRLSWQGGIGGDGWAALPESPGRVLLSPRSFALLLEKTGMEPLPAAFPPWGPNQRWMWQTLLNGLTLHPNFATRVLRGELRPGTSRGGFKFAADAVASVLAAPFVALISLPLEALAALFKRGGRMVGRTRPRV